jgi:hypothetical protein
MKHYKSPNNILFAYEDDGTQDYLIPKDYIAITKKEAEIIINEKMQENFELWQKNEISIQEKITLLQQEIDALKLKIE